MTYFRYACKEQLTIDNDIKKQNPYKENAIIRAYYECHDSVLKTN